MPEPTTGNEVDTSVADNSSTTETTVTPADSQATTETGAENTPVQPASTESAQTKTQNADDENAALTKFAKGQGINDLSELSEREISLLKMARDNKSAYDKTKQNQPKLEETSTQLATLGDDATDIQKLAAKVANMEYKEKKTAFMQGKDVSLEPVMARIVSEKRAEYGDDYARALLNDLPTLYSLASSQSVDTSAAVEAARREERSSMNQSLTASAGGANATTSKPAAPIKVTSEWIRNEYNPNNPEHRALVDAAMKK